MIQCFTADILLPELCLFGFSRRLYGEYAITLCLAEHLTRLTQLGIFLNRIMGFFMAFAIGQKI